MPRYLPPLSVLLSVDNLPPSLGFVENGINSIFSRLYFKYLRNDSNRARIDITGGVIYTNDTLLDQIRQNEFLDSLYKFGIGRLKDSFGRFNLSYSNINSGTNNISGPNANEKALEGSGGTYLSNEIFYRVAVLRNHLGLNGTLKSGHLHVPILDINDLVKAQTDTLNVKTIIENAIQGL